MEHFYQNIGENWFTYAQFYKQILDRFSDGSHFVEVGSWKGRSSCFMAVEIINSGKKIKFDCVDIWKESKEYEGMDCIVNDTLYEEFLNNIKPVSHAINPIRSTSIDASKMYADKSLDFVFIDACHYYECVKEDIDCWLPKVKTGGIISGHDIASEQVRKAVAEKIPNYKFIPQCDVWIHEIIE